MPTILESLIENVPLRPCPVTLVIISSINVVIKGDVDDRILPSWLVLFLTGVLAPCFQAMVNVRKIFFLKINLKVLFIYKATALFWPASDLSWGNLYSSIFFTGKNKANWIPLLC